MCMTVPLSYYELVSQCQERLSFVVEVVEHDHSVSLRNDLAQLI